MYKPGDLIRINTFGCYLQLTKSRCIRDENGYWHKAGDAVVSKLTYSNEILEVLEVDLLNKEASVWCPEHSGYGWIPFAWIAQ